MDTKVVKGVYDNGKVGFDEPVNLAGKWQVEITFIKREDGDLAANVDPHSPEKLPVPDRLEEMHRSMEDSKVRTGPG